MTRKEKLEVKALAYAKENYSEFKNISIVIHGTSCFFVYSNGNFITKVSLVDFE